MTVSSDISPKVRLHFLDAVRAFAILMMLQGHFISGLLDPTYKNYPDFGYKFWLYCRGFTAPLFFTITGWVFAFLLFRNPVQGLQNPRIGKGIRRAIELFLWGYALRLNLPTLFKGKLNPSFIQPDVLHIIALGLVFVILVYGFLHLHKKAMFLFFLVFGVVVFITQPIYTGYLFESLPRFVAGYLTKANGGVFYMFPWLGYVSIGAAIACVFKSGDKTSKRWMAGFGTIGLLLIYTSSWVLNTVGNILDITLLNAVANNNFLFIRLGDVFVIFGVFMLLQPLLKHSIWQQIGTKTLSLYIVHYFVLYGSLTGLGIYKFLKYSLDWPTAIMGATAFVIGVTGIVIIYFKKEKKLRRVTLGFLWRLKQLLLPPRHR